MLADIKLVAFDVDGTLTEGNIWPRLHKAARLDPTETSRWIAEYYEKKLTFPQWADKIIEAYRKNNTTRADFENELTRFVLVDGVLDVINSLRKTYILCLVSSGVVEYVRGVAKALDISLFHANYTFLYGPNDLFDSIIYEAPENIAKVKFLEKICRERNIKPQEIVFVGDSVNDKDAFLFTGHGILVGQGTEELAKASWKQVHMLKEILPILL